MDDIKICCPKCSWEPDGGDHWECSCGFCWDTFSTGGRCPACKIVWEKTQCIEDAGGCNAWSPHLDWYHGLEAIVRSVKEEILQDWKVIKSAM